MKGTLFSALMVIVAALSLAALASVMPRYLAAQQQLSRLKNENATLAASLASLEAELAATASQRDAALAEMDSLWRAVIAEQSAKTLFRDQLAVTQAALEASQAEVVRLASALSTAEAALAAVGNGQQVSGLPRPAGVTIEPTAALGTAAVALLVVAGAGVALRRREADPAW